MAATEYDDVAYYTDLTDSHLSLAKLSSGLPFHARPLEPCSIRSHRCTWLCTFFTHPSGLTTLDAASFQYTSIT